MAGIDTNQLRSSFVSETTPGTTPTTPAFKNTHVPVKWTMETQRFHQPSLSAGGARLGDALLTRPAVGRIEGPMVYSLYDPLWADLLQGSWSSDVLKDGKSWSTATFENSIRAGVGGTRTYMRYRGVEPVAAQLQMNARREMTFSMDLIGMQSTDTSTSAVSGATYTDPVNDDPFSAHTDVNAITLNGFTLDGIASMTVDLAFQGRDIQPQLGGDVLVGIARGAFIPTITLRCYVDANFAAILDAARATTQSANKFSFTLGSVTTKKYTWEFWRCYIDAAPLSFDEANAFQTITLTPRYHVTEEAVLTITRAVA